MLALREENALLSYGFYLLKSLWEACGNYILNLCFSFGLVVASACRLPSVIVWSAVSSLPTVPTVFHTGNRSNLYSHYKCVKNHGHGNYTLYKVLVRLLSLPYMGDVFRSYATFKICIAYLIISRYVRKANGKFPFAVKRETDFHTFFFRKYAEYLSKATTLTTTEKLGSCSSYIELSCSYRE